MRNWFHSIGARIFAGFGLFIATLAVFPSTLAVIVALPLRSGSTNPDLSIRTTLAGLTVYAAARVTSRSTPFVA